MTKRYLERAFSELGEDAQKSDIDCKDIIKEAVLKSVNRMTKKQIKMFIGHCFFELMDYSNEDLPILASVIPIDFANEVYEESHEEIHKQILEKEYNERSEEAHKFHLSQTHQREL